MLRGPVQATFPTLEHFPREVGTSGHVYPFPARSVSPIMHQAADLRLPTNMASATFWRSPYSEAQRQSKSSLSSHSHRASSCGLSSRDSQRAPLHELNRERNAREEKSAGCTPERRKSILKSGSEGRGDSASDTSSENRQIRGILCKSSVSSSSRQSGSKVQKRVKFDDSVDKGENGHCCRHHAASSGSGAAPRHDHQQQHHHHRSLSASVSTRAHVRMPSLRHDGDRLQSIDKSCLHHSHAQCNGHHNQQQQHNHHHHHHHDPHQHPHIPRPSSGPMIRSSSVPDLALPPRPTTRGPSHQSSFHVMHDPLHTCPSPSSSASPPSISSARTCPGHLPLEFKIYRQPGVVSVVSPRVSDTGISPPPPPPPGRAPRFFATRCHGSGARSFLRLSRALTSPTVCLQRPVKRPTPSSPHEDLLNASRLPTHMDFNHRHVTTREVTHARQEEHGQEDKEEEENREGKGEERRESFLDEDKTVQILHWLKEVDHKQSREGRCPVFLHSIYRES